MKYQFKTTYKKILSDIHTPVELYLKLRDRFPHSFLLESSDYKSRENSFSYLCLSPISSFEVKADKTTISSPGADTMVQEIKETNIAEALNHYARQFHSEDFGFDFLTNGLFGYTSYDAVPLFEDIEFKNKQGEIPLIHYQVFKHVVVFNHFNNELFLFEHLLENEEPKLEELADIISHQPISTFKFATAGTETCNFTDEEFLKVVEKGIDHCKRGDVFQVVLSRKFQQQFKGDEFNVYRALRSINPSPYLFYFDYGNFKLFGSSPEAQLRIKDKKAYINPIAGTFKRTGDLKQDEALAQQLYNDPKENAEHVMLVDLARNDLSRNSKNVQVESFKDIEYYSHVIHLVSKVGAVLEDDYNPVKILGDTYPAGTLSGAPKHRAMEIIDENEPDNRGLYGGAIGFMGFNGEFNHAIFIRSFMSKNNKLTYQAGAGVVIKSNPQSELQEINNKLSALKKALELAKTL